MTGFFETKAENLEPKEDKKKSSKVAKKLKDKNSSQKRKREDSDSSVAESSEKSSVEHRLVKKYCILLGECIHTTDKFKALHAMVTKHKQKKRNNF